MNLIDLNTLEKKVKCLYHSSQTSISVLLQLSLFEVGMPWLDWEERQWHVLTGLRSGLAFCPPMGIMRLKLRGNFYIYCDPKGRNKVV